MVNILEILRSGKFWKELLVMTVGMMVGSAAVYYFLLPGKLIIGTISGLSIVLGSILGAVGINIRVSVIIFAINAILLILAYFLIGNEFGIKTVYTALILGPMMDLWEIICPYTRLVEEGTTSVMGDPWFDLLCFVLLLSASQTILFNINASTGGLDILGKIVNKYLHFDIGTSISIAGAVICCSAFAIHPFRMVVIGLIGTWINGLVVDYFTAGLNRRKRVCIISDRHEEIRKFIIEDLHRGCTLYDAYGGYSGEKGVEIQSLLTQSEFSELMKYLKDNRINAFTTAGNVSEIYGLWFNNQHKHKKKH